MPNGSRHVPWARPMASRKSAAVSSSQWTEGLLCTAGDCAHTSEAQRALIETSSDLCTCPPPLIGCQLYTLHVCSADTTAAGSRPAPRVPHVSPSDEDNRGRSPGTAS